MKRLRDCERNSSTDSESDGSTSSCYSSSSDESVKDRQQERQKSYLQGRAHRAYRLATDISAAFEGQEDTPNAYPECSKELPRSGVCSSCVPVLNKYAPIFKGLKRQGSELKRRKVSNPHPKHPERELYRDLVKQNDWLRANVFDSLGNYLFCSKCVHVALGVSYKRLARQRRVKRREFNEPIRHLTKQEVVDGNLSQYVVMPDDCDSSFLAWWKSVQSDQSVQVRYPHHRHGLAGKKSNSSKSTAKEAFLQFVDSNSQPNGRSADSASATHYLLPKFRTIQIPKAGVCNYEARVQQSLVGEFNRVQEESNKETISNYSGSVWLKKGRPKHCIYPHKKDYCDTCAKLKLKIQSKQMSLTRLRESGSSTEGVQIQLESDVATTQKELEKHKEHALKSHEYYTQVTTECKCKWEEIKDLEVKNGRTEEEDERLGHLKHCFTAVISADYQMSKLVPFWGVSPQPGSTYYLQKLSNDIFGRVDHRERKGTVYIFDERTGPKNTDHTVSYIFHFLQNSMPSWIRRVHVFLDNACSTNKNAFLMAWAMELIQQNKADFLRVSFMVAGHTKFEPDRLFSLTAKAYISNDVFTTNELANVMSPFAQTVVDDGSLVFMWCEEIEKKYSKMPGIRELHDFVAVKHLQTGNALMKVREQCYGGPFHPAKLHVLPTFTPEAVAIPTENYREKNRVRELSTSKLDHLRQMYTSFIPQDRHATFI